MKQEEPEVSDELRALKEISEEVTQHKARITNLYNKGTLKEVAAEELASTIMPLFADLADSQLKHAAAMEDWLGSLEDDIESGGENSPDLSTEELELFSFLLARFKEIVLGMKAADGVTSGAAPELAQGLLELEVKISAAEKVIERLSTDGTEEEEDEDEETNDEEEDSEGDGDDDGES